jgi:hypothetical protein
MFFLHGDLQDEMYMKHHNLVCMLRNTLYGLKQTPRAWLNKLG